MAVTMKDFGIDGLSPEDRLALVQEIWDSLAAEAAQIPLSEAQKAILDRRLADLDSNPNNVLTWDEIKARVRGQR
jgi:putative addiction module component (TIGR02574 family)